jgi:hypothetical protein
MKSACSRAELWLGGEKVDVKDRGTPGAYNLSEG